MQIKDRQKFLTILTLVAVGLLVVDKIVSPPLEKLWHERADRIKTLKEEVKEGDSLKRSSAFYHRRWTQIQASTLTNNTTMAEQQLFTGLNRWSQSSGITIKGVTPNWKQGADVSYKTLECRVEASGSLDRLSRFLYDLEKDPMALRLNSVELASGDNDGTVINAGLQISGLVLTGKEPPK